MIIPSTPDCPKASLSFRFSWWDVLYIFNLQHEWYMDQYEVELTNFFLQTFNTEFRLELVVNGHNTQTSYVDQLLLKWTVHKPELVFDTEQARHFCALCVLRSVMVTLKTAHVSAWNKVRVKGNLSFSFYFLKRKERGGWVGMLSRIELSKWEQFLPTLLPSCCSFTSLCSYLFFCLPWVHLLWFSSFLTGWGGRRVGCSVRFR